MKLYNTLSRQIEDFHPLDDKKVTIYSCGPTVYDHIHIGNLSSFIAADTLQRALAVNGYKVKQVMNFTDVDDKTIARSKQQYPDSEPLDALKTLTKHYSEIFLNDLQSIGNNVEAITFVNATDSIKDMQTIIKDLYDNKFAYIAEDGIYFSIKNYKHSGKTYGQLADITVDSTSHARIRNDEYDKESAHDFALWKLQTDDEPGWDFELDGHNLVGRPGWHIECSAMSSHNLGQPFDIHTGGVDLIFPHHENEIAQSTAGQDNPIYAKYFVHNEHLLVNGRKMSKSLNNFITLRDVIEKGYDPLAFRLMILQSHYRHQSNFTWENLESAQNRLKDLRELSDYKWQTSASSSNNETILNSTRDTIQASMQQDLNTPQALAALSIATDNLQASGINSEEHKLFQDFLEYLDKLFGLELSNRDDISADYKSLIVERDDARKSKNWNKSDEIREQLEKQGIGVRDTEQGAIWYRL